MPNNNYLLETESDLLYDPARYTGIDQVVVDNDNDTIGLSASFISTVNNKLDSTTFASYTANHASDDNTPYSAGSNINITNHVVSGKDWSNDIASSVSSKLDTSTFNSYSGAHSADDNTPYSAGSNINITNHVISGKDWNNDISNAITGKLDISTFNTYSGSHSADDNTPYSAGSNINITNHVISGKDWTSTINSSISSKLDTSTYNTYTATHSTDDITPYSAGINLKLNNHVFSIDTDSTITTGSQNFVANHGNTVSGDYNTVIGNSNNINGLYNFVGGNSNQVTGSSACFVFGNNCTAKIPNGYDSFIFGKNCKFTQNSNATTNCNLLFGNYSEISANSYVNNCVLMGEMNKLYIADMYQWGYIVGSTNTISGTPNVSMNGGYIFGANNKINSTRRGFLFGDSLTLNSGTDDYKMKLGYDATNHGYSHRAYIQIDASAGKISTVIDGTENEIQNKLTGITDVQVVTALPASPVANVLYLVKE